jgi:hypothetical protein
MAHEDSLFSSSSSSFFILDKWREITTKNNNKLKLCNSIISIKENKQQETMYQMNDADLLILYANTNNLCRQKSRAVKEGVDGVLKNPTQTLFE